MLDIRGHIGVQAYEFDAQVGAKLTCAWCGFLHDASTELRTDGIKAAVGDPSVARTGPTSFAFDFSSPQTKGILRAITAQRPERLMPLPFPLQDGLARPREYSWPRLRRGRE